MTELNIFALYIFKNLCLLWLANGYYRTDFTAQRIQRETGTGPASL
jgi:hypothetical protein